MHPSPLLQIRNLCITFKKGRQQTPIIQGMKFEVHKGETLAIVGESGCGKSVTAQAIMRLLDSKADIKGEILWQGEDLLAKSEDDMRQIRGKKIGMIFQDPLTSLNPVMKIGSQIAEGIRHHEKISAPEAREKSIALLRELGIGDPEMRFNAYPFQLSGGMRQRVMIAIALSGSPQLLIADEPTTALDVTVQAQIMKLLQCCQQKYRMSLLLITHDPHIVAEMADRVVVLRAGQIVETGSTMDLFENPRHSYTKTLFHSKRAS